MTGLGRGLSDGLARWRAPRALHDPGKIVADLAAAVALGGDCLADIAVLREQPALAGPVASDPMVSRLVRSLAGDAPRALTAIRAARAAARERAWALAGDAAPGSGDGPVIIHLDATIVIAHSEKEQASPTWKKTFGHHPMTAWADHGAGGNGEPLAIVLRAGNAGSLTAADHIEAARLALAQLRLTDIGGHRFTCFATDTKKGQLADRELRHRRRARCEDRIRCAKDTGLRNLPLKGFAQNQLWCEIVALACELIAWTQMLALAGAARRWESRRLRLRVFAVAGPPGQQRATAAAPAGRALALVRRDHRRGRLPVGPPIRLTSHNTPTARKEKLPGPVEPRPPCATAGQPGTATR